MGSFNVACSVSKLSISPGMRTLYIPLEKYRFAKDAFLDLGEALLIYPWIFYVPKTLPIAGEYDDYGRIAPDRNEHTEILEAYFDTTIGAICTPRESGFSDSGMFVLEDIYQVITERQLRDYDGKDITGDRSVQYDKYREQMVESKAEYDYWVKEDKRLGLSPPPSDWWNPVRSQVYSIFSFQEFQTFNKLYQPLILEGKLKDELCAFAQFLWNMQSCNTFFFPAMNGEQCGNRYMEKVLLEAALKIVGAKLAEREED